MKYEILDARVLHFRARFSCKAWRRRQNKLYSNLEGISLMRKDDPFASFFQRYAINLVQVGCFVVSSCALQRQQHRRDITVFLSPCFGAPSISCVILVSSSPPLHMAFVDAVQAAHTERTELSEMRELARFLQMLSKALFYMPRNLIHKDFISGTIRK